MGKIGKIICFYALSVIAVANAAESEDATVPIQLEVELLCKVKTGHLILSLTSKNKLESRAVPENVTGAHESEVHDMATAPYVIDLGESAKNFTRALDVPAGKYNASLFFSVKPDKHCAPKTTQFERQPSCFMGAADRPCSSGELDTDAPDKKLVLGCG